ncbi:MULTISPECIES: GSCFA domain-containing protein [Rufibacter]|uniref:Lysophospholipase L1-like esterase n=1 Tax=Rufibacter quisquiliarum TaxID=1549639 RepID=A0A839GZA4_9BACT|nr:MULTISPECIES: GSCFA domain-containing protein [Rufibacter]MBA9079001.1 lysophospholipase L1-like esterase [Rufibacter quisquiliarum]
MQFRTEIHIPPAPIRFSRTKGIFTIGSCFAEVIGRKLRLVKANAQVNPFGTIFNPLSAHKLIRAAVTGDTAGLADGLVERQGLWFHHDFHSSYRHAEPEGLLQMLREALQEAGHFLKQAQALLLTWGTAYVYERNDNGTLVANCHKVPQRSFSRRLLTLEEITQDARQTLQLLQEHCPTLQVILTVSPVRHVKDTLVLNNVSKSILRLAAHLAQEQHPMISYFPAYELLLDDLRDYRFYGADLIHPSEMAETYIWEKFIDVYADQAFSHFLERWAEVQRDLTHRAFNPDSSAHQQFLQQLLQKLQAMALEANVHEEIATVQRQLRT